MEQQNTIKVFDVEGFGQVGLANLYAFIPFEGYGFPDDLEIGETTEGVLQKAGSDHKPERIVRVA